jgi:hypothetical protein
MARHRLKLVTATSAHRPRRSVRAVIADAFSRWRFRNTRTFTCADCPVTRTVPDNASGADLRRAHALATEHARHGVRTDRLGKPFALTVYGD